MKSKDYLAITYLHSVLKLRAPYDTGNLALNSIRIAQDGLGFKILIGGEIAPYAPITNAKWISGNNPNEGWIQKAINEALPKIKEIFSGDLTEEEIIEYQAQMINTLKNRPRRRG